MKEVNKLINKFIQTAGKELSGEWVLIGGTVLPAVGLDIRTTVDIDIIKIGASSNKHNLSLMECANKLNLPIESINQAGVYFLNKIKDYKKSLVILFKNNHFTLYRPNVELYFKLKLGRLSDSDLMDCIEYYKFSVKNNEIRNKKRLCKIIVSFIRKSKTPAKIDRLNKLSREINK